MAVPDSGCGGKAVILMAVSDAGFGGSVRVSHGSFTVIAIPDAGCGVERRGFSCRFPDAGCARKRLGFSRQSQCWMWGGRGGCSHFSSRCWLWEEGDSRFSWQS